MTTFARPLAIYCAGIGSVKEGNFAWSCLDPGESGPSRRSGPSIEDLVKAVADRLNEIMRERVARTGYQSR